MPYLCTTGKCHNEGQGTEVEDDKVLLHTLNHARSDLQSGLNGVLEAVNQSGQQLVGANGKLGYPHATIQEVVQHAEECPDCKANRETLRQQHIEEYKASWPKPEPAKTPEPTPKVEAAPAPTPAPALPKRLVYPTLNEVPGSPFDLEAYGIRREETDQGVQLRVEDEDAGKEAVAAGVVPACRWVKDKDGEGFWACEGKDG